MRAEALQIPIFPNAFYSLKRTDTAINTATGSAAAISCTGSRPRREKVFGGILKSPQGRYLLVQGRLSEKWSFPKGHIEIGESPLECVCREIREETGLTVLPNPISCIPVRCGTYYLFWTPEVDIVPRDKCEIMNAGWFLPKDAKELRLNVDANTYFREMITESS
jgi:8-oxo-dGTP pyrophosphatase MutT (NUDIX family)